MQLILFRKCVDMFLNVFCSFVLLQAFPWIAFFSFVYWNCFLYNFFPLPRTIIYDVFFFQKISLSGTFTFDVMKSFQICPFQERLYSMPVLSRKFPCQELSHLLCFFFRFVLFRNHHIWCDFFSVIFLFRNFHIWCEFFSDFLLFTDEPSYLMWFLFRNCPFQEPSHFRWNLFRFVPFQEESHLTWFSFPFQELCKPELRSFLVFCCDATCACSPFI